MTCTFIYLFIYDESFSSLLIPPTCLHVHGPDGSDHISTVGESSLAIFSSNLQNGFTH